MGFLFAALFGFIAASTVLYALETARTLLGILPLIGYLATIALGFRGGLRDASLRNLWMIGGSGVVMGSDFLILSLDRMVGSEPSRVFATNAVVLFCLMTGLQFATERLPYYSRLTATQRRWYNGLWLAGVTLVLLLYLVYGIQGDLNLSRFSGNFRQASSPSPSSAF